MRTRHAYVVLFTAALLFIGSAAFFVQATADDEEKTLIERLYADPKGTIHDLEDPTADLMAMFRDPNDNPKREPGPINIQKTTFGQSHHGIPTFFRQPVALGPEDLKAGKVEVAFMGSCVDLSTGMRGTAFGPQAVRAGWYGGGWGLKMAHPSAG